jgi:small multidrug resistance pump
LFNWVYLIFAIIAEVVATSSLKKVENFSQLYPSVLVIFGYGFAFYFLSLSLRSIPLAVAYAIWSGAGIALIALIGWIGYHQRLSIPMLVGILLIMTGIVVLKIYSK